MATTVTRRKPKSAQSRLAEHKRCERRAAKHREQMIVAAVPIEQLPEVDPAEEMQIMINLTSHLHRYAMAQVDALVPGIATNSSGENMDKELWVAWDDNQNLVVTGNYWIHREVELREQLRKLTEGAQKLGLGARRARVAEAQVLLLGEALQAACKAAGVPAALERKLGGELRTQLVALESNAMVEVVG